LVYQAKEVFPENLDLREDEVIQAYLDQKAHPASKESVDNKE
jgi:hypothetical protein